MATGTRVAATAWMRVGAITQGHPPASVAPESPRGAAQPPASHRQRGGTRTGARTGLGDVPTTTRDGRTASTSARTAATPTHPASSTR